MRILLVEGEPGVANEIHAELDAAGHRVTGCDPADPSVPCRGLDNVGDCPLDAGEIDVAVVGRRGGPLTVSERGALCASRRRIPVVVAGDPRSAVSFGPGTHMARDDLLGACERAAVSGAAHVAAVQRTLLISGAIRLADLEGDDARVAIEVSREPSRLRMVVRVPGDDLRAASIAKSAAEALRRFDPYTTVIDVVVSTT